jgi:IstB-like ATP binding protein
MLTEPTLEKLKALRLDAFAAAWLVQQQDPALATVPFDERLGLLVEAEWLARENRRLATALREAKLRLVRASDSQSHPPESNRRPTDYELRSGRNSAAPGRAIPSENRGFRLTTLSPRASWFGPEW